LHFALFTLPCLSLLLPCSYAHCQHKGKQADKRNQSDWRQGWYCGCWCWCWYWWRTTHFHIVHFPPPELFFALGVVVEAYLRAGWLSAYAEISFSSLLPLPLRARRSIVKEIIHFILHPHSGVLPSLLLGISHQIHPTL
jgi:hypothetical protein